MTTPSRPSGFLSVMAGRREPPTSLDYFPTPAWGTRALCEYLRGIDPDLAAKSVWEPACGRGHMIRPLSEYFGQVHATDVHDYGHGGVRDFLFPDDDPTFDWIITNPPFRLAARFVSTALERAREGVAMVVRTSFLEGIKRYETLYRVHPPTKILQFAERLPMHRGRVVEGGTSATSYCWIVWLIRPGPSEVRGPEFVWIPRSRRRLERPGDYLDVDP